MHSTLKSLEVVLVDSSFYVPQHESIQSQLVTQVFFWMFKKLSLHNGERGESCLSLLWSVPGFASHFLSDDGNIILSSEMKRKKELGLSVPRKIAYNQRTQRYDPNLHLAKPIWSLYSFLYVIPWTLMLDGANTHTFLLAVACARKAMVHAKCPYARMSYPSLLKTDDSRSGDPAITRSEFYLRLMGTFFGSKRGRMVSRLETENNRLLWVPGREFLPGMTLKEMLLLFMDDEPLLAAAGERGDQTAYRVWRSIKFPDDNTWTVKPMTVQEKIELLNVLVDYTSPEWRILLPMTDSKRVWSIRELFLDAILGEGTKQVLELHDFLISDEKSFLCQDKRAFTVVQANRALILEESLWRVEQYQACIMSLDRSSSKAGGDGKLQPLPKEIKELIAEFAALPDFTVTNLI